MTLCEKEKRIFIEVVAMVQAKIRLSSRAKRLFDHNEPRCSRTTRVCRREKALDPIEQRLFR
jgi:hypothetical protein